MNFIKSKRFFSVCVLAAALAGCNEETENKENTEQTSVDAVTNDTKVYVDALSREVEIPTNPQRVVALWTLGEMLALDTTPVGSTNMLMRYYTEDEKQHIELVGDGVTGDYEKILSLNPDVIVLYALAKEEEIEQYSKIAPTVTTQFFGEPLESLRDVGEILNKEDEAEAWIRDYEARVEQARSEFSDMKLQNEKAVVLQLALKNMYLYRSGTFPTIFEAYEFQLSNYQQELEKDGTFEKEQLSMEILPQFEDVDRIFLIINDEDSQATYEELQKSRVWNNLPAVKNNRVHLIDNRISMTDVMTLDWALDEVKQLLK